MAVRVLKQCKVVNPIIVLTSGQECIDFFEGKGEYGNRSLPCLLFLDLSMQPISGVEVLQRLKAHLGSTPNFGGSVVIMLPGVQDLKLVNEGYQIGASTFLVKPLRSEDIMQIASAVRGLGVERNEEGNVLTLTPPAKKKTDRLISLL